MIFEGTTLKTYCKCEKPTLAFPLLIDWIRLDSLALHRTHISVKFWKEKTHKTSDRPAYSVPALLVVLVRKISHFDYIVNSGLDCRSSPVKWGLLKASTDAIYSSQSKEHIPLSSLNIVLQSCKEVSVSFGSWFPPFLFPSRPTGFYAPCWRSVPTTTDGSVTGSSGGGKGGFGGLKNIFCLLE